MSKINYGKAEAELHNVGCHHSEDIYEYKSEKGFDSFMRENGLNPDKFKDNNSSGPNNTEGCYIATCVYGSYNCPEVWRLRRYRDYYLDKSLFGRMFIKLYYAISPLIVKCFGKSKVFRKVFKSILDKKQAKLSQFGYSDLPYIDKY